MKKKIIISIICTFLGLILFIGFYIYTKLNKISRVTSWDTEVYTEENEKESDIEIETETEIDYTPYINKIDNITNILLLGEEAIEESKEGKRGRTDTMIVLTLNKKSKGIKITSLMRDTYVKIPGHKNNKLNSAYNIGGVPLAKQTVELNYGIKIDGCVLIGFDDLEKIVDILGGVDVQLTKEEMEYLNENNYISKEENRNLVEGMNHLNGNQAIGYCRIRYVATGDNESYDFGRTSRQRKVLKALFDTYKSKSIPEMIDLMDELLPYVQTDLSISEIIGLLGSAITMNMDNLETYRLPIDDLYKDETYSSCGMVLVPYWIDNLKQFWSWITDSEITTEQVQEYLNSVNIDDTSTYGEDLSKLAIEQGN